MTNLITKAERLRLRELLRKAKRQPVILKGPRPYELRDANRRRLDYSSASAVVAGYNVARALSDTLTEAVRLLRLVHVDSRPCAAVRQFLEEVDGD